MHRLSTILDRKSVCRQLHAMYAVRETAEKHPHAPLRLKYIRVYGIPYPISPAVDNLVAKLERPRWRIGY